MKAVIYEKYGPPDVLGLAEVDKPVPASGEVLVKIHAAAVNPLDKYAMRARPHFLRLMSGIFKPRHRILGADIAGRVEAVGENLLRLQAGDAVYGDIGRGGFAEYVAVPENKLERIPANLSFAEAAAVPVAGLTALQCLRDQAKLKRRQRVLINGASGGVGTFAVQIAKVLRAQVTGVCSTPNVEMVRAIGADQVIDYTKQDFTQGGGPYDLILDNVGNRSLADIKGVLAQSGTYLLNAYAPALMFKLCFAWSRGRTMQMAGVQKANPNDLEFLSGLLERGKIAPVIDREYPMGEVAQAVRYIETGRARGKVVIDMGKENGE